MGTIVVRPRKDGTKAYMAKIVLKRNGAVVHRETKTFDRRPAASAWIARREEELAQPGAIERARSEVLTFADAIDRYVRESKQMGKTKAQVLKTVRGHEIAALACDCITSQKIVELAQELAGSRQPQTITTYLSHLGGLFSIARPAWGYPLDDQAMRDARKVARKLGVSGEANKRTRRPTLDELDKLMQHFGDVQARSPGSNPMQMIIAFAIFSTRRQEEITRIAWPDLDETHSRVLVRDMKHPGQKRGNDAWCDLPAEAMRIIKAQPRRGDRIFPYNASAISAAFTRACVMLEIDDLHFHDLRHEGISRLFELGWNIPHVATVSGHRSWQSLKRYAHLRQIGDKYAGWKWLDIVTRPLPQPPDTPSPDPCAAAP